MKKRLPATMLPVIVSQGVYARAVLAAEEEGRSLAEYVEAALLSAVHVTTRQAAHNQPKPFVRRPAGVASYDGGRPSSRQFQPGQTVGGRVNSAVGGSGAAGAQRRGEHPPVEAAEQSGTSSVNRKNALHL